jgi:hypothetical protein
MLVHKSLDDLVRRRLRTWPQHLPGLAGAGFGRDVWMRGRPAAMEDNYPPPFLKLPGTVRLRTLPDGLWLNFGGKTPDGYVDILAIEACGTLANLLDKRSRFAPSVQSLLAVCPVPWLLAPVAADDDTPRWRLTGLLKKEPREPLILPVRDIRVLYGLKTRHYLGFATTQVPHPHEYFVPVEAITAENGHEDPALQALLERASARANFMTMPSPTPRELAGRMPPIPLVPHQADR